LTNPLLVAALALCSSLAWSVSAVADATKVDAATFSDKSALSSDFDALYAELKTKHPDLYHRHGRAEWDARYAALRNKIPRFDWPHYVIALHRFVAMAADGHTNLLSTDLVGPGFDVRYAARFGLFSDGLYLISGTAAIQQGIGGRVLTVNGHPIKDVERQLASLTGHDSPMWAANWVPLLLTYPGNIAGLDFGSLERAMKLSLAMPNWKDVEVLVPFEPIDKQSKRLSVFDVLQNGHALPSWWAQEEPLTFQYWKETRTVYALFAHVSDGEKESLKQISDRMFAFISVSDVQRLIIDVRQNGGGDNTLLQPIIDGAKASKLNRLGSLYVVIGRQTFSAAQNFVNRMESSTQALFAGEPTGESPNQSGEPEVYHLPHTQLPVLISTKRWLDSAPEDHRIWTMPDVPASLTFDAFVNGRDPVIEAILSVDVDKLKSTADLSKRWMRSSQSAAWTPLVPIE
jgi:hypothetical protein